MINTIYVFLIVMWILIILGGGLAVLVLGPLDLGEPYRSWNSTAKALIAIGMVVSWVLLLVRLKRYIFRNY